MKGPHLVLRLRLMVRLVCRVNQTFTFGLAVAVLCAACHGEAGPATEKASPPYLTIFLIDGMTHEVFTRELTTGRLPNLDALVRDGTLVKNGVSSFPSMTGYAFYPFITGEDAAKSGVLGLRWLDRDRADGPLRNYVGRTYELMNGDLRPEPKTIFERVGNAPTHTFNSYMNRGATKHPMGGIRFTLAKYRDSWWLGRLLSGLPGGLAPTFHEAETVMVDEAIAMLAEAPKVQWITLTSPDGYAHVHGITDGYAERLHDVDTLIGRYRDASRAAGQESDRLYAIVTDHGLAQVDNNLDVVASLAAKPGLAIYRGAANVLTSGKLTNDASTFAAYDGVVAINGNTMAHLYLRRRDAGFTQPYTSHELRAFQTLHGAVVDVIEGLRATHGIELVAARGDSGGIDLFGPEGEAKISRGNGGFAYAAHGIDPLGYSDLPQVAALMDGNFHDGRDWLAVTATSEFPDAIARLGSMFAQADAGDIIVTSISGYDLAADYEMIVGAYRGGHGGLRADQMRVPYIFYGPGVRRRGHVDVARAEDVGTTIRALMGLVIEPGTSGIVLPDVLK